MNEPPYFDLNPNSPWGRSLTKAEITEMFSKGRLEGEILERYWRMNEFQQPMPSYLEIWVNESDAKKLAQKLKRALRRKL